MWRELGRTTCWLSAALLWSMVATGSAQEGQWLTNQAFESGLQKRLSINSVGVPLGQLLDELASTQHVALVLDRRIDRERLVTLVAKDEALRSILAQLAEAQSAEPIALSSVVYLGPRSTADSLQTLVALREQELASLPEAAKKKWHARAALISPRYATPREIVSELATSNDLEFIGSESLPHDLWAEIDTPPLTLLVRLTLVLAQFDRTFRFVESGGAEIVPIPPTVVIKRSYRGGSRVEQLAQEWRKRLPNAKIEPAGNEILVWARVEDHERLQKSSAAKLEQPTEPTDVERVRIDKLTLERLPLEDVLQSLAQQLELTFDYDTAALEAAGIRLDQLVTIRLENATIDELLRATLAPVKLEFKRQGRRVKISPRKA